MKENEEEKFDEVEELEENVELLELSQEEENDVGGGSRWISNIENISGSVKAGQPLEIKLYEKSDKETPYLYRSYSTMSKQDFSIELSAGNRVLSIKYIGKSMSPVKFEGKYTYASSANSGAMKVLKVNVLFNNKFNALSGSYFA